MEELFQKLDELNLTELWDRQLKMQVDYPWPKEALSLEEYGLGGAKTVLDIGTGNAYFLCRLAKRYPNKNFVGIEASGSLVEIARRDIEKQNLKNVEIIESKCPADLGNRKFDFIFSRLVIYSTPQREDILSWAHDLLVDKGSIAIIDCDLGFSFAYPESKIWMKLAGAWMKAAEMRGGDLTIGRKLPYLLSQANFKNIRYEQKNWFSSLEMTPEEFQAYWPMEAMTVHKSFPDLFTLDDLKEFELFLENMKSSKGTTASLPMYIVGGDK